MILFNRKGHRISAEERKDIAPLCEWLAVFAVCIPLLNKVLNEKVSDTRRADSSNADGYIIIK